MKKTMVVLLLLCLTVTNVPVGAEEYCGIGWEVSGEINRDHFSYLLQSLWMNTGMEGSDEMLDAADAVLALVNGLSFSGEAGKNAVHGRLLLNEQPIFEAAAGQDASGGLIMDTSLLPGYGLTIPADKLLQMEEKMSGMMQFKTPEEQQAAAMQFVLGMHALFEEIGADFAAKKVSESDETVAVDVQGEAYLFGRVTEYRLTGMDVFLGMKKLMNGALPLLKEYLVGMGVPEEEITIRLSQDELAEDDPFARAQIRLKCYSKRWSLSSVRPAELWTAEVTVDEKTIHVECLQQMPGGMDDQALYLRAYELMDGEEITILSFRAETGRMEEESYFVATLDATGTIFVLDVRAYERLDGGREAEVRFYLNNPDAPLGQLSLSWWPLTETVKTPATEGKQLIDVLEPMDDETAGKLENGLKNGLGNVLMRLIMAAPEETETLMNLLVK